MSLFHNIPNEVLCQILDNLDQSSLAVLSRASRFLNTSSAPFLWATISLENAGPGTATSWLRPIVSTLMQRRDLASHVKQLKLREIVNNPATMKMRKSSVLRILAYYREFSMPWPEDPGLDDLIRVTIREFIDDTDEESIEDWYKGAKCGDDEDAILTLLLFLTRNLEHLDLGFVDTPLPKLESLVKKETGGNQGNSTARYLPHLKHVLCANFDTQGGNHTDLLHRFLGLPSLQTFRLWRYCQDEEVGPSEYVRSWEEGSLTISSLELRLCIMKSEELFAILKACRRLKTFIYDSNNLEDWHDLSSRAIREALGSQEESIEYLGIGQMTWVPPCYHVPPDSEISFHGFHVLQYLKVSPLFLGNKDPNSLLGVLPASLRTLHWTICEDLLQHDRAPALLNLLSHKMDETPQLHTMKLEGCFSREPGALQAIEKLKILQLPARSASVKLLAIHTPMGYDDVPKELSLYQC